MTKHVDLYHKRYIIIIVRYKEKRNTKLITDTFKIFKKQVESAFPNYMVDYSPANNRVFVFKGEEPFCIAKIFLERHGKYMVFDVNTPDMLLEMIADYSMEF